MANVLIAIDPGLDGALVALEAQERVLTVWDMPTYTVAASGKRGKQRRELDTAALVRLLGDGGEPIACVVVERQQAMPGRGKQWQCPACKQRKGQGLVSTGTTMKNYGILLGIIATLGLRLEVVASSSWKAAMMKDMPKEKEASLIKCKQVCPQMAQHLTRKKDHNRADACLIGLYALRFRGLSRLLEV